MNRRLRLSLSVVALTVAILALGFSTLAISVNLPCAGFGTLGRTYDFIISINTEKDPSLFEYPGSLIGPVVRTSVSYVKPNQDEVPPVRYEDLWYHNWQALGLRRYNTLDLGNSAQVAVEIKHREEAGSSAQNAAAANAALRIVLDVFARKNSVACIIVPDADIQEIGTCMATAGFTMGPEPPPEQPVSCILMIPIITKSGQFRQILYYDPL